MLTGSFREHVSETVDIIEVNNKQSIPGSTIPETVVQSQIECIVVRKSDPAFSEPGTTQEDMFTCYITTDIEPKVSQVVKLSDGSDLTIVNKPRKFNGVTWFNCQKTA